MNVYREQKYIQDRQLLWFARFYSCRRCNEKSYADCSLALPTSTRTGNRRTISVSVSVIILLIVIVERNYFVYCQSQYFQSKIKYMWQFHCFSPSISLKCQKRPKVFKHKFIYRENKEIHKWRVIHVLDLILYTSPGIVPLFPWVEWLKSLPSYQIPTLDVSGNIQTINLWY